MFLGLRYEVVGAWHENRPDARQLPARRWRIPRGANADGRGAAAARADRRSTARGRQTRSGLPDTLINTDKNNFSPRVGFAWRLDESNKTVLRGGFGLFHPTVAVQGIRDLLATNEFRFVNTTTRRRPPQRLLRRHAVTPTRRIR